jgi:hypothetical protein
MPEATVLCELSVKDKLKTECNITASLDPSCKSTLQHPLTLSRCVCVFCVLI